MVRKILLLVFGLAISVCVLASDFEVRIVNYPKEVPLGAPVEVSVVVTNVSGHSVVIARGNGGFRLHLEISRTDGKPCKRCKSHDEVQFRPGFVAETIPKDWSKNSLQRILCDDDPGEWIVSAELTSIGPYPNRDKKQGPAYIEAWTGKVSSNEVRIKIVRPAGVDLKAFKATNNCPMCSNSKILKEYPTSFYAAYQVYRISGAQGMAVSNPHKVAEAITGDTAMMGEIWVPSDTTKDKSGLAPLSGKAAVEWRQKWFNIVLKHHPDIWFADDLRLKLAADQVALKNYQAGAMDLQTLSKDASSNVAEHAKAILEAMEKRGFIKDKK